jgi:ParB family chromosome partitioning protein
VFTAAQLRTFLRLLLHLSPYGLFEDAAAHFVNDDENHEKIDDEILIAALDSHPDDKLTGFALRLVLTDHVVLPRKNELDFLAEAETASASPKPEPNKKPGEQSSPPQTRKGKADLSCGASVG